mmetsp:Transcript_45227/g.89162  ORF Transcript_45227/g.89162 Transcript_45227/m.89162 type:complete len:114 (-) Transcript_45227:37-378(-)
MTVSAFNYTETPLQLARKLGSVNVEFLLEKWLSSLSDSDFSSLSKSASELSRRYDSRSAAIDDNDDDDKRDSASDGGTKGEGLVAYLKKRCLTQWELEPVAEDSSKEAKKDDG